MEFKYIMMNDGTRDIPFIFPKQVAHVHMLQAMRSLPENMERRVFWTLVSAGFVTLDFPIRCFGESDSIREEDGEDSNYQSRPGLDGLIIQLYNYQHGQFEPETAKILINMLKDTDFSNKLGSYVEEIPPINIFDKKG
jgi:hypothetical protein